MRKDFVLKIKGIKVILTAITLILAASTVVSLQNVKDISLNRSLDGKSGEPIWIYDSDLYIKHVETADLNGDGVMDVIAAEYDSTYYDTPSKVYGINGSDGDTIWSYSLNDGVRCMTIGDINNDGVMDVIAGASKGSSTPDGRVHAINGTDGSKIWTFTPGASGYTNGDVAVGNFDGDEYPDVAVACWDDYVYAINGSNGNQLWSTYIGSMFVYAVDTGDVNGDDIDDVAYGHAYLSGWDNYFGVLDGTDGSVIWNMTVSYPIVEGGVLMDDIDDDGELEAVFGNRTGHIFVRNASNGNLEWEYDTGPVGSPTNFDMYLFSYDIDNDSDLDLIVGNDYGSYYIYAFDGDSNTTMWISEKLNGYPEDIAFGDVIGDGNLNIIAATYDRVQILEASNGTKTWYYSVAGTIASVGCADFDGDGIMDTLAGGGAESSGSPPNPAKSVWALKTVESPLLWEFDFGEYGNALAIDDLNGDQYMDVVAVCSLDDKAWAINGEDGAELWNWTGTENLYTVTTGDFDNNGQIDVAVAGDDDRVTALYGNNGSVMWQFTTPGDQIYRKCLKASDLNGDGHCDVIAGSDDDYVYAIDGSDGTELWSSSFGGEVQEIELAQMDGTGSLDVVAAIGWSGNKMVVINGSNGNTLWEYSENTNYTRHVEVFDVNDDDVSDVAIGVPKMGATPGRLIMVDGDSHDDLWTVTPFRPCSDYCLAHGDINNDGVPDLIAAGNIDDKKVHAFNGTNGNEIWTYETGGDINSVAVEDVDFDNQLDVIAGSDDQNVYVISGNNGSCFWNYSTADDVMHIQLGDISGDGMPNIACVTFGSDGVVYAFKSFSPAPNLPPYTPSNPSPPDGAMHVDPDADLSWTGGDPNPGDTVTYDVYFGTSSPLPKIINNQTGTSYDPGTMNYNTKYYWKIVAWDNHNASAETPVWNFTTEGPNNPPNIPSDPDPEDGETDVDVDANLSWTGGDPDPGDTVKYDVYFGTTSPPPKVVSNQSGTTYDPGTMNFDTTYYWKIVAWDNHGTFATSQLWSFTTRDNNPPNTPSDPDPADGATDVDINADLGWNCSDPDGDDLTYDVYFEANDPTPDELVSNNQSEKWYDPGKMDYNTHYYWQIVAWDNYGESASGPVWDFITGSEPNDPPYPPSDPDPENDSTNIDIDTNLSWTGGDPDPEDTVVYDVYLEENDQTPDDLVADDISETTFDPGTLKYETTYYWRVITKDNHGASTPGPIWHFITKEAPEPNLKCDGSLSWPKVKPGDTVYGSFTVSNIGETLSLLDWEVAEWPLWGSNWVFTPMSGDDLKPSDEPVIVNVSVVAPDEKNSEFTGELRIVNKENSSDNCTIPVYLKTPMNQKSIYSKVFQFLQKIIQRFPLLKQILSLLPFLLTL